ncbi:MAG: S-methyl-5-thioribose-1-phosphate isomerase [Phycisphaerales bacterium]|nr:S-methyl-5-thioribose-1-phosphate isomerase [Phycisphaerales bacterium]
MTDGVLRPIDWTGDVDGCIVMIDQTLLPNERRIIECRDTRSVHDAIRRLAVRGAPAIGVAGAFGAILAAREAAIGDRTGFLQRFNAICDHLAAARPTGANLRWAVNRMKHRAASICTSSSPSAAADPCEIARALLNEARAIRDEDAAMCRAIGRFGEPLIPDGGGVMTYCNAGALATAEYGTALAPMYEAQSRGRRFTVFANETRPLLQGARLTAWELSRAGVDVVLICDNMAAQVMKERRVQLVITGADRIAANGDTANKIGTYGLAQLARAHDIPFYVAAPSSTFDLSIAAGDAIPIEQRDPGEIREPFGVSIAPKMVSCYCPAFDVTPAELIRGIITERGIIHPVTPARVAAMIGHQV